MNQQFAWCDYLLATAEAGAQPWRSAALGQTLTWHLQLAYLALLQELADGAQIALTRPAARVQDLVDCLPAGKGCPLEWQELARLEAGESWLSMLLARPTSPQAVLAEAGSNVPSAGALIAVAGGSRPLDIQELREALMRLREFVDRWRAQGHEY